MSSSHHRKEIGEPLPDVPFAPAHEAVAKVAADRPTEVAVRCGDIEVTYGELVAWSRQLSHRLAAAGVGSGDRVALVAEPSVTMIASVLGVLGAGAAYVPVDPAQPDTRLATILDDARVKAVVATARTELRTTTVSPVPVITVPDVPDPEPGGDPAAFAAEVGPRDPAYLIYTSGSTGEPKGVVVEHRNLAASTRARLMVHPGSPTFLLVSPLAFDSSVAGIWGTLQAGGCLVVATEEELRDPERLVSLVGRHRVDRLLCVPALYGLLLDAARRTDPGRLASLRRVIVAGEALPQPLVDRHFAVRPHGVDLVNEYGPTETTVWATFRRFTGVAPVDIGGPIPGARLHVLDDELRPVDPGAEGELFIGGPGVARGYFDRPEATAAVFLDDPFADEPGARMYRTGDIVRRNSDHGLDFVGRKDDQLKVRGHRVEPGAVESALHRLDGIEEAVVLPDAEGAGLVGFVASQEGVDPVALRRALAAELPSVMVPGELRVLPELPRNRNGKLDRVLLRTLASEPPAIEPPTAESPTGPAPAAHLTDDPLTAQVTAAWAEVLGRPTVPPDVNFFDLGGHSLAMFKLQDALEQHCGLRPSIVALFQETTVTAQVALIRAGREQGKDAPAGSSAEAARRARTARLRQQRARKGVSR
ncbi:non-ribosomal peptide synthetase [Streptomyces sp. 11x1]|uniref:non-ribosomal peptide synthetase n=1 Tax=Streptomyces sp. 11x1 TaxID=3038642 RepID=UPI00292FA470|nr:non-ribosomal peptide synthetase [Streptomyces sp. 11x1]WNZ14171.1 non-ribosomal peptide synthetase [Streptomyces sp. 11x1]